MEELGDLLPAALLTLLEGGVLPVGGLGVVPAHRRLQRLPLALQDICRQAVIMSERYITDRYLPPASRR